MTVIIFSPKEGNDVIFLKCDYTNPGLESTTFKLIETPAPPSGGEWIQYYVYVSCCVNEFSEKAYFYNDKEPHVLTMKFLCAKTIIIIIELMSLSGRMKITLIRPISEHVKLGEEAK